MKTSRISILAAALLLIPMFSQAQPPQAGEGQRLTPQVMARMFPAGVVSPEYHADGSVTFRCQAADAKAVGDAFITEPVSVRDFIAAAPADALKLICYCFDDVPRIPVTEMLSRQAAAAANRPIMILIGPEGDFSPEEAALARENGWIPVSLGESRLRTETAAVVAATAVYLSYCQ